MDNLKKILIVRNDHIGDLVLSTPVFRELKKKFNEIKITVIASKTTKPLLEKNPYIKEIWVLELPKHSLKSIWDYLKMSWKIRAGGFDVGVDLRGSLQISFFLLWLSGIKKRIGKADNYHNKYFNWFTSLFQTNPIKTGYYTNTRHITKENLYIINRGLGINLKNNWPEIFTDKKDDAEVKEFIKTNKLKDYICICPFTDELSKQWNKDNFKELIKWFSDFNCKILLIGPKWQEKELQELMNENPRSVVVLGFDLRKMALLFKKSKLVIAHDGGPFHIAWTIKAKTIELVRKWPPELASGKYMPLINSKVIWSKDREINNISLEEVKGAVKESLKR